MYNQLFMNIIFILSFPLDLQEKNHVALKNKGELWASPKKL
jgi:hypothetical protein